MANHRRDESPSGLSDFGEGDGLMGTGITSRQIEAFGKKVTSTAGQLMGPSNNTTNPGNVYHSAMTDIQRELKRPNTQRKVFALAQTTPTDLVRSKLSSAEIQSRALSTVPDDLLLQIPDSNSSFSLFQGFQVSLPEDDKNSRKSHRGRNSKLLKEGDDDGNDNALPNTPAGLKSERDARSRRLDTMGLRKNMCSAEIHEIDNKIANLHGMRKIVLDRLAGLEMDEANLEREVIDIDNKLEDIDEQPADLSTPKSSDANEDSVSSEDPAMDASFMSESIYQKLPSPSAKSLKHKPIRKRSMPILHEHFEPGSLITELPAHNDVVTAVDFDYPFGTMVSAALDDSLKVWDLNTGRSAGSLEGHNASVRCVQMEDNIVATGSMDASIRLWDLSRARTSYRSNRLNKGSSRDDDSEFGGTSSAPTLNFDDCHVFSLESHLDEVTALHFRNETLISGSSDKTLRQWDLVKGRCVQTLDVLWAAAQASATGVAGDYWRPTGRMADAQADFVGALQCFDAALACGTADGMIRMWDLRSGQVHRSLVGHTGPVTSLQFDDVHLVTGSSDRSIRIWDLRTGSIFDAFAYDKPITSMMFDTRRIATAAGENVVKVYDKPDARHWDCGAGVGVSEDDPSPPAEVEQVRLKEGFLVEGRTDGTIGAWSC